VRGREAKLRKATTITDVARRARVSPATVSNVLGERKPVTPELAERVRRAAQDLGYQAHRGASYLRSGRSRIIAIVVPSLENPFFTSLVAAIEERVSSENYDVFVTSSRENEEVERARLEALVPWRPAGVVIIPCTDAFATRTLLASARIPFVVVDRVAGPVEADTVAIDNVAAAALAGDHMLSLGHRDVLIVASSLKLANVRERCDGITGRFRAAGCKSPPILEVGVTFDSVAERLERWIGENGRPGAVIVLTNYATLGILAACAKLGIAIPDDLSFVGFDDYAWMDAASPSISAVRQPVAQMGLEAWACLKGRIAGKDHPPARIRLPCKLEIRQSTKAVDPRMTQSGHRINLARAVSKTP
jgi:LacI family transcriptional regulator